MPQDSSPFSDPAAPAAPVLDDRVLRRAFSAFPTGVCLVTTVRPDGGYEGMTINSFASVSLEPPLILWSLRESARSADAFLQAPAFVVSVLPADQRDLARHFARSAPDKFVGWESAFEPGLLGCPRLRDAVATYECHAHARYREGDHTIVIGRIDSLTHNDQRAPLAFHAGQMGSFRELADLIQPGS